ncbi:MAG: AAA family ATPase [Candidatus Sericytochromatia bacterium]
MEEKKLKLLPLGKQIFSEIIKKNNLYIDKTEEIYKLFENGEKYYFLSRPRMFGKSLLVSTLESIFNGEKELFKNLWIYNKIDFKKYPVIKLTMNDLIYSEGVKGFKNSLLDQINDIYKIYNIRLESTNHKIAFKNLIHELAKIEKVVLLIDEYDKPIINYIESNKLEIAKEIKEILREFYETIKANDKYLHFVFLTGVSKFSKTSVFSTLNNLTDMTTNEKYAKILGIEEEDVHGYFKEEIKILGKKYNENEEEIKSGLKKWYNGYSWNGKDFLYNPYSLLLLFENNEIKNYWSNTGTPDFLIKIIKDREINLKELENIVLDEINFESYDINNMNIYALLFQTGYLTIKEVMYKGYEKKYVLSYPNMEVKESFLNLVLKEFSINKNDFKSIKISNLIEVLKKDDIKEFIEVIKTIYADIPYDIFINDQEKYYSTVLYLIVSLMGTKITAEMEVKTHRNASQQGRIDAVIETDTSIFIFEFKIGSANKAMEQIEEKKYYEKYLGGIKKIFLVGVGFSTKKKNIYSYVIKNK